jgi:hypothetical protein
MKMARRSSRHSRRLLRLEKGFFYSFNVEVTGAARLYRAASVWTAGLAAYADGQTFEKSILTLT